MTAAVPTRTDPVREWLAHAVAAGRSAGGRSELWLPAALGHLVYLGWLPLVATVAPAPGVGDLAYLGIRLVSASNFPLNVISLVLLVVTIAALGCLAASYAEALLISAARNRWPPREGVGTVTWSGLAVIAVAAIPVVGALGALLLGLVAVAPDAFIKTPSEAEVVARLLERLWPFVAVLGITLLVAQAVGASALRSLDAPRRRGAAAALAFAVGDLVRHPLRRLGTAAAGVVGDLATLLLSVALLRVLWAPIGRALVAGRFLEPRTLLLLLGFIAIWLATVLAAGALRAWISTWWSLEFARKG